MGIGAYYSFAEFKEAGYKLKNKFLEMDRINFLSSLMLEALVINDYFVTGDIRKKGYFDTLSINVENVIHQVEELAQVCKGEKIYIYQIRKNFNTLKSKSDEILKFADTAKKEFIGPEINKLVEEIDAVSSVIVKDMDGLNEHIRDEVSAATEDMDRAKIEGTYVVIIITLLAIFLAMVIGFILTRIITKPISAIINSTKLVAKGDFTQKVKVKSHDEIGDLAAYFNKMTEDLNKAYQKIKELNTGLEQKVEERTRDLKQTQAQLVQSGKLAAIGQLGAGVAHELNNPVGGILGYAQYMQGKLRDPNFKPQDFKSYEKYLGYIEKEAGRCKTIVENLLKFSRRSPEKFELLNINHVIEDTLSIMGHQLMMKKVELKKELASDLKPMEGNANQLQQVFTNLIINAQQAMPQGGSLTIATGAIGNGSNARGKDLISNAQNPIPKGDLIQISFIDTGCGIPQENIDKISDPFFTTKMDWKGTGLGLSVSYKIIQNHKGQINVESEIDKGTTFTITLPIKE